MPVDKYVKEDVMDNKVFLRTVNDVAEASRGVTFSEKLQVFFGKRRIKKMIHKAAKEQAKAMYQQTCKFYNDIVNKNLR
jgi:hypothetical protein